MSASKVIPNLWVGSKPKEGMSLSKCVSVLVLCAEEYQPASRSFPDVRVVRCPLPDAKLTLREIEQVRKTGTAVAALVRKKIPVLVSCYLGLNRSGLVACVALCDLGMRPSSAIREVRKARGLSAMTNPWFERYLKSIALHHALGPRDCRPAGSPPYEEQTSNTFF